MHFSSSNLDNMVAQEISEGIQRSPVTPALEEVLSDIQNSLAPLWPLKDFVAVNPFMGLSDQDFLSARKQLRSVRDAELLLPWDYFETLADEGKLTQADLEQSLEECHESYPESFAGFDAQELFAQVQEDRTPQVLKTNDRDCKTIAEQVDDTDGADWNPTIVNEISRCCASHFDEGQAIWASPWKHLPLFEAWRETAILDRRMELLGLDNFRQFVSFLPTTPEAAIGRLLYDLRIPPNRWRAFCLSQIYTVAGWAAYVTYQDKQTEKAGAQSQNLIGLLAIRLAYDAALADVQQETGEVAGGHDHENHQEDLDALQRYALQLAAEINYRRKLCSDLKEASNVGALEDTRKTAQLVFCIDVRSERLRRALESESNQLETFGFAGFFGLPLDYAPLGESKSTPQLPVLLDPQFNIQEDLCGQSSAIQGQAKKRRTDIRSMRKVWKSFQTSAASCFSFVESLGLAYAYKLLTDSLGYRSSADGGRYDGVPTELRTALGPKLAIDGASGLSSEARLNLAASMLQNLGLTSDFARIVVLCGHEAATVNNPYNSAFDCGACGGHSGEPNARVAAKLLNDAEVREGLRKHRNIDIPEDAWFASAVHNTTTDELRFFEVDSMPVTHQAEFQQLRSWVTSAGEKTSSEQAPLLGVHSSKELSKRSRDWSEVRPEWGLAGNAAFVVAPRSRTAGLNLSGRTFMHSYDAKQDPDFKVLELIMTAPMIVTNWINLQYYASTVDNRAFGSGNKVIHNVVGKIGVFEGNGGDLRTGLTWQSVHDGTRYHHEPLRLLVMIEAPREAIERIVDQHEMVRNLVCNGWLSLMAIQDDCFYRYTSEKAWCEEQLESTREEFVREDKPVLVGS